jgi:glycosyltransferase involved in cell wall biosynthesis
MSKVSFSVVIPLYNKVDSICRTLASIYAQRYPVSEIIVIDDGSTDGSAAKVAQLNIANLKLVKQYNQGVSAARNNGAALAKYEYVAFLDADDQWSPFFLYEMSMLILRFPEEVCFASNYQKVGAQGRYIDPKLAIGDLSPQGSVMNNYFEICAKGDLPFMPSSLVITKRYFQRLGGFPVGEAMGEDQALFSQIALQSSIVYSPLVLMLYHLDSENRACDIHLPQEILPFAQRLLLKVAQGRLENALAITISKYCAAHLCHIAKLNIMGGNLSTAAQLLKHPISKLKPMHLSVLTLGLAAKSVVTFFVGAVKSNRQPGNSNSL